VLGHLTADTALVIYIPIPLDTVLDHLKTRIVDSDSVQCSVLLQI